jgi:hypothetical protein
LDQLCVNGTRKSSHGIRDRLTTDSQSALRLTNSIGPGVASNSDYV